MKRTSLSRAFFVLLVALFLGSVIYPGTIHPVNAQSGQATSSAPMPTDVYPVFVPGLVIDSLDVEREVTPDQLVAGEKASVQLTLSGKDVPECSGSPGQPVDIMAVFDISTSAGAGPGSNWEKTVGMTKALLRNLAQPIYRDGTTLIGVSQLGIISSRTGTLGPEPVLLQSLTSNYDLLAAQMDTLLPSGDTDLAAGLDMAAVELNKSANPSHTQAILLMLHDNVALSQGTRSALERINDQRISVYVIVNSLNIPTEQQISQSIGGELAVKKIYYDPVPVNIRELFVQASNGTLDQAARGIKVAETVTPSGQITFSNVTASGAVQGDQVIWNVEHIAKDEQIELTYDMIISPTTVGKAQIQNAITWLDCNGNPQSSSTSSASVEVQPPAITITPFFPDTPAPTVLSTPAMPGGLHPQSSATWEDRDIGIPFLAKFPWMPDWMWLILFLFLLSLLSLLYWLFTRDKDKQGKPSPIAPPHFRDFVMSEQEAKLISPNDVGQNISTEMSKEKVDDKFKRPLIRRVSWVPTQETLIDAIHSGKQAQIKVWLEEEFPGQRTKEICRAVADLSIQVQQDNLTGEEFNCKNGIIQWSQQADVDYSRGVVALIFNKIEQQAKQFGIAELIIEDISNGLEQQLKDLGYLERKDNLFSKKMI